MLATTVATGALLSGRQPHAGDEAAEGREEQAQGGKRPPLECGGGPVGMLEEGDQFRSAVRCLRLTTSPTGQRRVHGLLPVEDGLRFLFQPARAPHAYSAAPVRGCKAV